MKMLIIKICLDFFNSKICLGSWKNCNIDKIILDVKQHLSIDQTTTLNFRLKCDSILS